MGKDRGVSEVLSYSLVFGLILISIAFISVGGLDSLQSVRDAEQMNNAERAFGVLADNTEDIYRRDAPSRATELSMARAQLYMLSRDEDNTTIWINTSRTDLRFELTPIIYESQKDYRIIYEAGAIFRTRGDAGRIVREPPMHWGEDEQILTIVATHSAVTQSVSGTDVLARMKARDRSVRLYPGGGSLSDPEIIIESPRAFLWKRLLETKPGIAGTCDQPTQDKIECDIEPSTGSNNLLVTVHEIQVELEQ